MSPEHVLRAVRFSSVILIEFSRNRNARFLENEVNLGYFSVLKGFAHTSWTCWHHFQSVFQNSKSSWRSHSRKSVTFTDLLPRAFKHEMSGEGPGSWIFSVLNGFAHTSWAYWHHIKSVFENSKSSRRSHSRKSVTQEWQKSDRNFLTCVRILAQIHDCAPAYSDISVRPLFVEG